MENQVIKAEFSLTDELNKTIVQTLVTSFGLDFLLFEDKCGGDVDTVHNAREWQQEVRSNQDSDINISEELTSQFNDKGESITKYDSDAYHSHDEFRRINKENSEIKNKGDLKDAYSRESVKANDKTDLDHVVSAYEIHNDIGVAMSGLNGTDLANTETNLKVTSASVNRSKQALPMEEFISQIPSKIKNRKKRLEDNVAKYESMPCSSPQERHERDKVFNKISKDEQYINKLEEVYKNKEEVLRLDKEARASMNNSVNKSYYSGSKFLKSFAGDSAKKGFAMGKRQALGLILGEIWLELKIKIPAILTQCKGDFRIDSFLSEIKTTLSSIIERVKSRFKDLIESFRDGFISGVLSSITTTIWNMLQTTAGNTIKLIRETWSSLIQAIKLIFFNPQKLNKGDLLREVTRILGTGASVLLGTLLNDYLNKVMVSIPFGIEVSAFLSALVSGIFIIGLNYFLDHSQLTQKVWDYLNSLKSKYQHATDYYQKINSKLDEYVEQLALVELNLNPDELQRFIDKLTIANTEYEKSFILEQEVKKRNLSMPFEHRNTDSVQNWLNTLI